MQTDDQELARLTSRLRSLYERPDVDAQCREALKKAALALSLAFTHGLRSELDEWFEALDRPLTEDERQELRRRGIDPDAGLER